MSAMEIKELIKNRRLELGLTMKQVAKAVGVSEGTVSRWESGEISNMRRDKIALLAEVLQINPRILMGWDEEIETHDKNVNGYYMDPDTAAVAQELFEKPGFRVLFDAARNAKSEDMLMVADILKRLQETNPDG